MQCSHQNVQSTKTLLAENRLLTQVLYLAIFGSSVAKWTVRLVPVAAAYLVTKLQH